MIPLFRQAMALLLPSVAAVDDKAFATLDQNFILHTLEHQIKTDIENEHKGETEFAGNLECKISEGNMFIRFDLNIKTIAGKGKIRITLPWNVQEPIRVTKDEKLITPEFHIELLSADWLLDKMEPFVLSGCHRSLQDAREIKFPNDFWDFFDSIYFQIHKDQIVLTRQPSYSEEMEPNGYDVTISFPMFQEWLPAVLEKEKGRTFSDGFQLSDGKVTWEGLLPIEGKRTVTGFTIMKRHDSWYAKADIVAGAGWFQKFSLDMTIHSGRFQLTDDHLKLFLDTKLCWTAWFATLFMIPDGSIPDVRLYPSKLTPSCTIELNLPKENMDDLPPEMSFVVRDGNLCLSENNDTH